MVIIDCVHCHDLERPGCQLYQVLHSRLLSPRIYLQSCPATDFHICSLVHRHLHRTARSGIMCCGHYRVSAYPLLLGSDARNLRFGG